MDREERVESFDEFFDMNLKHVCEEYYDNKHEDSQGKIFAMGVKENLRNFIKESQASLEAEVERLNLTLDEERKGFNNLSYLHLNKRLGLESELNKMNENYHNAHCLISQQADTIASQTQVIGKLREALKKDQITMGVVCADLKRRNPGQEQNIRELQEAGKNNVEALAFALSESGDGK